MPLQIFSWDTVGSGTAINLGEIDHGFITAGTLIAASTSYGFVGTGSNQSVFVAGEVISFSGCRLGDSDSIDHNNKITVSSTGSINGVNAAVVIKGANSLLINQGHISSFYETGVSIWGDNARVFNDGYISGHTGVSIRSIVNTDGTQVTLENHGTIFGTVYSVIGDTDFSDKISNYGTMTGLVYHGGGDDILMNRGLINGNIDLGAGNDLYDNRGGVVNGQVLGGDGNDTFRPGTGAEVIDGGLGTDTLDFRGTGAVQVALDGSLDTTGNAEEDVYTSIEQLYGSRFADLLVGSTAANFLKGFAGADTISGGAGADRIVGGSGVDVLTGGAGNDQFIFNNPSDGGDVITDFGNTATNNDVIRIDASAFSGGLVAGVLAEARFVSRADTVVQTADHRFIFRTSDRSLWFDVDGTGEEGPVMIADLQASATLTAADFSLF